MKLNGVLIVAREGRIVLGEESNSLREKLKNLVAEGKKKIVLNVDKVKYIDSAGLGTLIAGHISAQKQGVTLRLCNLGSKFHENAADHQAGDRIRCLRYGSRSNQQFLTRSEASGVSTVQERH